MRWTRLRVVQTLFSLTVLLPLASVLPSVRPSLADEPDYMVEWWTVDGGGVTVGQGGLPYSLGGTVGQPDAGRALSNGSYVLTGGFWAGVQAESAPGASSIYLPLILKN